MRSIRPQPFHPTVIALSEFVSVYQRRCGERLNLTLLMRDMHALRNALDTAIGSGDADVYTAAEQLVLTMQAAPLPTAA